MKKILHTIYTCLLWMGFVGFALSGCKDDELVKNNGEVVEGLPVTVTLTLSGTPAADVTIDTRADNSLSDITNLAIFVFHEDGTYEHYVSSRATDESYKVTFVKDQTVDGGVLYNVSFKTTTGKKKLIAVANTSAAAGDGGFWELTAKQEDVVGGLLSFDEIKDEIINLRSALYENSDMQPIQIVSSSLMLLSGCNEGVVFGAGGTVTSDVDNGNSEKNVIVKMDRAMAKIKFKIVEKPKDDFGNDINATFRPSSYRVYNIPTKSYLTNKVKKQTEELFTSSSGTGSESGTATTTKYIHYASSIVPSASEGFYSFEFYMPENIQETKTKNKEDKDMEYVDRDKWKGTSGSIAEKKVWLNAPQNSTFVVISGTYSGTGADGKDYTGNVSYTIHLGDFSPTGSMGNFSVERNSSYTYTITVKGVDKIIAEAKKETDNEYQQGAEGQIFTYDASTYSYELDAHYEQIYLEYNLSQIAKAIQSFQVNGNSLGEYNDTQLDDDINKAIANNLILVIQSEAMDYINTTETSDKPYTVQNKRGTLKPYQIYADAKDASVNVLSAKAAVLNGPGNTTDNLKGFDYKWIEFWPQSNTEIAKYPGVSKWSRENLDNFTNKDFYGGTAVKETAKYLMDVYDVIVAMGNVVKKIYKRESVSTADRGEGYPSDSQPKDIFNSGQGITVTKNTENEYVARFTAFVNEYYYLRHPLTGERVTTWSVFANKMNREMLIAMSSNVSEDGNSSFSTVYSYISQLSMQTFYNSRTLQMNGFGIETYNETPHIRFGGSVTTGLSDTNGRSNQILLLGKDTPHKWETFIDPVYNGWLRSIGSDRINHKLPVSVYKGTREESEGDNGIGGAYFACLSRNRDLNGNGDIDENEVRWYLPSINEYIRIGVGSNAISNAAQLYMGDKYTMEHKGYATSYIWDGSLYFTSSNQADKRVYWAVERGSYGDDGANYTGNSAAKPIRCIRSLPSTSNDYDISTPFVESDPSFIYHKNTNPQSIEFKDRLVANLYRQRVDGSLDVHNEDNPANSFSQGIFVADKYLEGTYRLGDIIGYEGTVTVVENGEQKVYTFDGTMLNPCEDEKYSEGGYSDWRVPNLVELSAMNAAGLLDKCYSDDSGSFIAACCTQFSNLNVRFGFARSSLIYCPGGGAYGSENPNYSHLTSKTFRIRCVRDVPDGYTFDQ